MRYVDIYGKEQYRQKETANAKVLRQEGPWQVRGLVKRQGWLEQNGVGKGG